MKKIFILFFIFIVSSVHLECLSQSSSKSKNKFVFATTALSYYSAPAPYIFSHDFKFSSGRTDLSYEILTSSVNIGVGFQIRNENGLFHEFGLTKFSKTKYSDRIEAFHFVDELNQYVSEVLDGSEERSITLAFRYELGKYFGKKPESKVKFGLSIALEPTYYKYTNYKFAHLPEFYMLDPFKVNIVALEFALIPILSTKLTKNIYLDLKAIPHFLITDIGRARIENPSLTIRQQTVKRDTDFFEFKAAGSLQIRYLLRESQGKK